MVERKKHAKEWKGYEVWMQYESWPLSKNLFNYNFNIPESKAPGYDDSQSRWAVDALWSSHIK